MPPTRLQHAIADVRHLEHLLQLHGWLALLDVDDQAVADVADVRQVDLAQPRGLRCSRTIWPMSAA